MTTTPSEQPDGEGAAAGPPGAVSAEQAALDEAAAAVDDAAQDALEPADVRAMDRLDVPRRVVFVHAHPDDESIATGATMARYAAQGADVTLVTCTRGEEGEVIPADLAHLAADRDDTLADHRVAELAAAMEALGVRDWRFLDAVDAPGLPPVHYRDSGMVAGGGGAASARDVLHPDAFAAADVDDAAARLAVVLREVRPQVLVTYEPGGGYGHPDHVQAHRVALRAVELAADPDGGGEPWAVAKVYEHVAGERELRAALRAYADRPDVPWPGPDPDGPLPSLAVPDEAVTTVVDAVPWLEAKAAALRAHATQVQVAAGAFALSNGIGQPLLPAETYRLVSGPPTADPERDDGRESDLFAGLDGAG